MDLFNYLQKTLSEFWDERSIPSDPTKAASIDDFVDSLESITAVDVLTTIDILIGKKVPLTVIKAGGYSTKEEFVDHLSSSVMAWHETL